jgi:hypothetical protein
MFNPRRLLTFTLTAVILLTSTSLFASDRSRRLVRAVEGPSIEGRVVDSVSGAGVFSAIVRVGEKQATADQTGAFVLKGLAAGPATIVFERWGYDPVSQPFTIQNGRNVVNIALNPRPVVKVRTIEGEDLLFDADSSDFMGLQPFSGYQKIDELLICAGGTSTRTIAESQIKLVTNIQLIVDTGCCSEGKVTAADFTLRDGSTSRGSIKDCIYYSVHFVGRNRLTGVATALPLSTIARIEYP